MKALCRLLDIPTMLAIQRDCDHWLDLHMTPDEGAELADLLDVVQQELDHRREQRRNNPHE